MLHIPILLLLSLHPTPFPAIAEQITAAVTERDSAEAASTLLIPFRDEIERGARKEAIPASLIAALIQEESRFDPWATRTEPSYLRNYAVRAKAREWVRSHPQPTLQTEIADRSRSMGLMQVMGEVAREQGFSERFLASLYLPEHAIFHGAKLFHKLLLRYRNDTLSAISAYNQGNARKRHGTFQNARYVYRVVVAWRAYERAFRKE